MRDKPYVNERSKQILREAQERRQREETKEWMVHKVQERDRVREHSRSQRRNRRRQGSVDTSVSEEM